MNVTDGRTDGRTDTQTPHRRRLHSIALTTDRHEASRGLSTTAELLVVSVYVYYTNLVILI